MKNPFEIANKYLQWANDNNLFNDVIVNSHSGSIKKIAFSCQAKSYKKVHEFSRKFRIKFDKAQGSNEGTLDYSHISDTLDLKLYAISELAPNCQVVYEDVIIPASEERTERQAIVICK